jgi:hypothetical protein
LLPRGVVSIGAQIGRPFALDIGPADLQ